ncbi:hypothetical protein EV360DRAFT_83701 [Lentinula raphanica]|nr:hypothetical protein EV360DRAFT_83701 [Lentinula raphanica]
MGKWTTGYCEDVLSSKIKSLVSGAIKRYRLEKFEPEINFERFAEELDVGDSFTTSLFDVLVKELADRQSRSNAHDRQLIAERTARSLRTITHSNRIYSSHRSAGRSRSHIGAYFGAPPEEIDLDEEDELHTLLEESTSRRQHDAIIDTTGITTVLPSYAIRSSSPAPITSTDEVSTRARPWIPPRSYLNSSSSLTRSSSLRRPTRSRTVDFNDFTSRRRSTTRSNNESTISAGSTVLPSTWAVSDSRERDTHPWPSSGSTRRFFSLRARRPEHELNLWSDIPDSEDGLTSGDNPTPLYIPPSTTSSRELTLPPTPPPPRGYLESTDTTTTTSSEHTNTSLDRLPRYTRNSLRRLGYSLSRQPSPTDTVLLSPDEYEEALRRAPSPPEMSEYSVRNFESSTFGLTARSNSHIPIPGDDGSVGESEVGATFSVVGAAAYPTPGSPGSTIDN